MVSQHFQRVAHHADEAEVLRGGMLLSYGMHREAGEVFARLIEKGAPPAVRDRAWFYLAKIRYQRGYLAEAKDAHRPHRQAPARRAGRRARAAAGQPADRAGRLRRRGRRCCPPWRYRPPRRAPSRYERRALRPLQPRRRADQERRRGRRAARCSTRSAAPARQRRGTAQPARPRQPGAGLCGAGAEAAREGAQLPRTGAPERPAGQQGAARLRLGRGGAEEPEAGARAVDRAGAARPARRGRAGSAHRRALCLCRAGRASARRWQRYNDAIAAFERESRALDGSIASIRSGSCC